MYVTQHQATRDAADRIEVIDALYRFALGQDLKQRDLFASSFADDAELDFRPAAAKWGAKPPLWSRLSICSQPITTRTRC